MKTGNGAAYPQNYDIVVKRMADVLCGEILKFIGLNTGRAGQDKCFFYSCSFV